MKTRLVQIGNSRGVRIPKPLIEQAGIGEEVELHVTEAGILIEPVRPVRTGWAEAAEQLRKNGEDGLLDDSTPTEFDDKDWSW